MKKLVLYLFTLSFSFSCFAGVFAKVDLSSRNMVHDASRNQLLLTVNSSSGIPYGNNVVAIDIDTQKIVKQVYVGSEPSLMAMSKDNAFLYVYLSGAETITRVNLATFETEPLSEQNRVKFSGLKINAIDVKPNSPNKVLLASSDDNRNTSERLFLVDYLTAEKITLNTEKDLFDRQIGRPGYGLSYEYANVKYLDEKTILAKVFGDFRIAKFIVNQSDIRFERKSNISRYSTFTVGGSLIYYNNRAYLSNGQVFDSDKLILLGSMPFLQRMSDHGSYQSIAMTEGEVGTQDFFTINYYDRVEGFFYLSQYNTNTFLRVDITKIENELDVELDLVDSGWNSRSNFIPFEKLNADTFALLLPNKSLLFFNTELKKAKLPFKDGFEAQQPEN